MADVYEESLKLHEEHHGKLGITSKVKVENMKDLSLAYTPGFFVTAVQSGSAAH